MLPFRTYFSRNDVSKTNLLAFPVSRTDQTIVDPSIGSHFNYTGLCALLRRKSFSQPVSHFIWRGGNLAVACLAWPAFVAGTLFALAVAPTSAHQPLAKSNTQQKIFYNWLFAPKTQRNLGQSRPTAVSLFVDLLVELTNTNTVFVTHIYRAGVYWIWHCQYFTANR